MDENDKKENIDIGPQEYIHFKNPVVMPENTNTLHNISNPAMYLFSKIYAISKWVLGLRWYKTVLLVIVGSVLYVMAESIIEHRKERRQKQKEGMKSEQNVEIQEDAINHVENSISDTSFQTPDIYDLVVRPSIYSFFRIFGFR